MTGPTTVEEIPWSDGSEPEPTLSTATPRKCKHPKAYRSKTIDEPPTELCHPSLGGCGHTFDRDRQKRGRNVRKYGKKEELADARELGLEPRGTSRDPEDSGGALDPAVVQSKTGPIHYPSASWIAELEALGKVANGRPRILVATPKTGPGIKRRKVAVLYLDELQELTGLRAERRALLALREEVRKAVVRGGMGMRGLAAALEEADRWKR